MKLKDPQRSKHVLRFGVAAGVGILLAIAVIHTANVLAASPWIQEKLGTSASALIAVTDYNQLVLLGLFSALIGGFVHRFAEPYFVLWYSAWLSWFFMYLFRSAIEHQGIAEFFNNLNTILFANAAVVLLVRKGQKGITEFPKPPTKTFGSPLVWLYRYYRQNKYALAMLIATLAAAVVGTAIESSREVREIAQSLSSVIAISLLAIALARKMYRVSPMTAYGCLIVHLVYLAPQLNALRLDVEAKDLQCYFGIWAPALALKPLLALLVVLLALRESSERNERKDRFLASVLDQLPHSCLVVRQGRVIHANRKARARLRVRKGQDFEDVFGSHEDYERVAEAIDNGGANGIDGIELMLPIGGRTARPQELIDAEVSATRPGDQRGTQVFIINERRTLGLADAVSACIHDLILPLLRALKERLQPLAQPIERAATNGSDPIKEFRESLRICKDALRAAELVRHEMIQHWRGVADERGADIHRCLRIAWVQAKKATEVYWTRARIEPRLEIQPVTAADVADTGARIDESGLIRVLQNVLANAIRAACETKDADEAGLVEVTINSSGRHIQLQIGDRGPGFDTAVLARLAQFGPPRGELAIGFGLHIARLTVARAGGQLRFRNEAPRGASVTVVLRRAATERNEP